MNLLVVESDSATLRRYSSKLSAISVQTTTSPTEALSVARSGDIQLILLGRVGDCAEPLEFLRELRQSATAVDVILMAEQSNEEMVIAALRAGAWDYLKGPVSSDNVCESVMRWMAVHCWDAKPLAREFERIVGISPAILRLRTDLAKVAQSECNVLITGETGTGKEMVAELIHSQGPRARNPMVCVNCAAVPDLLLESELFGYDRGAFTGATCTRDGKMRQANGGTLFFDEVGEMTLQAQAKILRAIESRVIQRLGGQTDIPIDVRIVAATNQELEQLSGNNLFRRDLFFRLNVVRLHLPPLRERSEDVPGLLEHFVQILGRKSPHRIKGFTKDAIRVLQNHSWPGNVRELRNVVEALFVSRAMTPVGVCDLPLALTAAAHASERDKQRDREALMAALQVTGWNKSKVAQKLHWSRMTVYRKMAEYGIQQAPKASPENDRPSARKMVAANSA
jgi:Response regulator containing CheY-like receiver, AAA-type ATPase, and DNA-binding domains